MAVDGVCSETVSDFAVYREKYREIVKCGEMNFVFIDTSQQIQRVITSALKFHNK